MQRITKADFVWFYNLLSDDTNCPYDDIHYKNFNDKLMNKIFNCNNYVINYQTNDIVLYDIPKNMTIVEYIYKNKQN